MTSGSGVIVLVQVVSVFIVTHPTRLIKVKVDVALIRLGSDSPHTIGQALL